MRKTRTPAKEEREARSHGAMRRPCQQGSRGTVADRGNLAFRRRATRARPGRRRCRDLRQRRPAQAGRRHLECVARVARRAARTAFSGAALRRGALPDQVLAAARLVHRGRTGGDRRGGRSAHADGRVLDGRGRLGGRRRRALGGRGARPGAVAPRAALARGLARQALARRARQPRPRGAGHPGRRAARVRAPVSSVRSHSAPKGSTRCFAGAVHGVALRAPWGVPLPLPRARELAARSARTRSLVSPPTPVRNGTAPTSRRFTNGHFRARGAAATKEDTSSTSDRSCP